MNSSSYTSSKASIPEMTFFAELVVVSLMVVFNILGRPSIVSSLLAINYILVAILLIFLLLEQQVYQKNILLAFFVILVLSFASMIGYGTLSFTYARKWLMFFCLISLYFWAYFIPVTKRMISAVCLFSIFQALVFVWAYFTGRTYPLGTVGITFNLTNPNFTGMWLLCVFLLLCVEIEYFKNRIAKAGLLLLALLIFYFTTLTNARGSIIPAVLFVPLRFVYKKRYNSFLTFCMMIFPLVFALLYLAFIENEKILEIFDFMVSEGKNLDSRIGIWKNGFDLFAQYPLLGNYYRATGGRGVSQYHNIYVDTLCTYGIIVQAAIIAFLCWILNGIGKNIRKGGFQLATISAFYMVIVSGCFEGGLFANSQGVYVLSAVLLLLARYHETENTTRANIAGGNK